MNPDPFTRNAIILMLVTTSLFFALTFIGTSSCAGIKGIYETIETEASSRAGIMGGIVIPTVGVFGDLGEVIGYTVAGIASGLVIGYYWSDIFGRQRGV